MVVGIPFLKSSNVDAINVERAVAQEAVVVRLEGLRKRLREVQGSNTALALAVGWTFDRVNK